MIDCQWRPPKEHLHGWVVCLDCYNNHICIYFTLPIWKEKELKIQQNTRQTDNNHTRWHLIWKDKIRHRSKHTSIMMTNQRLCAHRRWHHQAPEHEHTQKNSTHGRPSTSYRSTDQHRTTRWTPRWTTTLHTQKEMKACPKNWMHIHMTHRTDTSKHFTLFHCNHSHHWHGQKIY